MRTRDSTTDRCYVLVMMQQLGPVDVRTLMLDPFNPRLPESVQGGSQAEILHYLYENEALFEIVNSYVANGYFPSEPLIVGLEDRNGVRVVKEGNRRLASLMILLGLDAAVEAGISPDIIVDPHDLDLFHFIPCIESESDEELAAYLGFRHISGPKKWEAEAKARWIWEQVERTARADWTEDPFTTVGRIAGSNARGVRSAYTAFAILRNARNSDAVKPELVDAVLKDRFGVWMRLLGTANALSFLGMSGQPKGFLEVSSALNSVSDERVAEMLGDLAPKSGTMRSVLADSRDVTKYSTILESPRALETLRASRNLELAYSVAEQADLPGRLDELRVALDVLTADVRTYEVTPEAVVAGESLLKSARLLASAVSTLGEQE